MLKTSRLMVGALGLAVLAGASFPAFAEGKGKKIDFRMVVVKQRQIPCDGRARWMGTDKNGNGRIDKYFDSTLNELEVCEITCKGESAEPCNDDQEAVIEQLYEQECLR